MTMPYGEHRSVPWRWAVYGTAALIGAGAAAAAFIEAPEAQQLGPVGSWAVPLGLAVLALVMFVVGRMFATHDVVWDGRTLHFGYRGLAKDLTPEQIEWADETRIVWLAWGGMGWRIDLSGRIGYIVGSGPGIELRSNGRTYVFNCAAPADLLEHLRRADVPPRSAG